MSWTPTNRANAGSLGRLPSSFPNLLTTDTGGNLTESIHRFINETRDGDLLRIMSHVIDDEVCVEDILAARQRGVFVRILTTLADRHGIRTKGWNDSRDIDRHSESIRQLAKGGVILRSPHSTPHGKFLVRNKSCGLFGSANLAKGSLRGTALEAGLQLEDRELVASLAKTFDAIWKMAPFAMHHRNGAVILEEGTTSHLTIVNEIEGISGHVPRVLVSGPGCPGAKDWLVRAIKSASLEVILVAMSFYQADQVAGLHAGLLDALKRGVRIRVLVRLEYFKDKEAKGEYPDSSTLELIRSGLELYGIPGLHAKGFVVDNSWAAIQSANFNPYSFDASRAECNFEILLADNCSTGLLVEYAKWINLLAESACHRWMP